MIRSICAAPSPPCALLQRRRCRGADRRPLRPDRRLRQLSQAGRRRRPPAARQRQHAAQLHRLSRQRGPRRRPARGLSARVVPSRRHRRAGRDVGDGFWGRDADVGLSGAFGTTVLGRTPTPLWLTTIIFNPFGESFGFSPSTAPVFRRRRARRPRWNNSIAYTNNPRDPLRVVFAANARETTQRARRTGHNFGGSVSYITGPFAAALAWREDPEQRPAAARRIRPPDASPSWARPTTSSSSASTARLGRIKTEADRSTSQHDLLPARRRGAVRHSLILVAYGRQHGRSRLLATTDRSFDRLRLLPLEEHRHLRRRDVREAELRRSCGQLRSPAAIRASVLAVRPQHLVEDRPRRARRRRGRRARESASRVPCGARTTHSPTARSAVISLARQEGVERVLRRVAFELRPFHARLAADQRDRAVVLGQVDLEHHAAHRLALPARAW